MFAKSRRSRKKEDQMNDFSFRVGFLTALSSLCALAIFGFGLLFCSEWFAGVLVLFLVAGASIGCYMVLRAVRAILNKARADLDEIKENI